MKEFVYLFLMLVGICIFGVYINSNSCTIGTKLRTDPDNYHPAYFSEHLGEDKKEATIIAVDQFLDFYNEEP